MKALTAIEYIIVGQGLAGSAVALQLLKLGKRIMVIDEGIANTASRIAAGLFNPLTGRKFIKTWLADQLFPYLHQYYNEAERITGQRFFYPMPLYRPFVSIEEQNEWMGKSAEGALKDFVETVYTSGIHDAVNDPYGGVLLKQCGYLNTSQYINAVHNHIASTGVILHHYFDEDRLKITRDYVQYQDWRAEKIIFCQGERSSGNKWFRDLPIHPLKGETLTIKCAWEKDVILNRGVYMVPGNTPGEYRVGATYNFNDIAPGITPEGRLELEDKLKGLINLPYEVLGQNWGFRPTSKDRRPILGHHPHHDRLVIFNGLGTKGVSLAPYFSEVLVRWLESRGTLNKDVSVTRYK